MVARVLADRSYETVSFARIQAMVKRYDGIARARARAQQFTDKARTMMAGFPSRPTSGRCMR